MWEEWIHDRETEMAREEYDYDKLLELAVSSYNLDDRCRILSVIDRKHHLITWWMNNRRNFTRYYTYQSVGDLMNLNHSTIIHYMARRKKSFSYESNVESLEDFLSS
jgi:hypothetical protein